MNRRDREFVNRLDAVVREIGSLTPANPMDVAVVARNLRIATAGSKSLAAAISAVRCSDWRTAGEHLADAERITSRVEVTDAT